MNRRLVFMGAIGLAVLAVGAYFLAPQFLGGGATNASTTVQSARIERGTLTTAVSAAGTATTPRSITLNWKTSGTVGAVHVSVGQTVQTGDVLLELDPASLPATIKQAQANLLAAQEALATAKAGPTAPVIAQAEVTVVTAQKAVATAEQNLKAVTNPNVAYYQDQLNRAQANLTAAQQNATVTDFQTSLRSAQDALTNAQNNLKKFEDLEAQYPGYGQQHGNALENARKAYERAQQDYETALYKLEQQQASNTNAVTDAQTSVTTAEANLRAVQTQPNAQKVAEYQAQLALARANLATAQENLATLKAGPDAQAIATAEAQLAAAEEAVDVAQLVAPFNGTIISINQQAGDLVANNQTAIVLADLSTLDVTANISEVDINQVQVGQKVTLTADAAPGQMFEGQVAAVTVVGTSAQGVVTFPVKVVVPKPDPALKPGMTVAVSIVTDEHANVLLVPNRAIRVSSGQRSVTVLFEGQQFAVPVTLGLSNDAYTEVVDGSLKEGDTVVLNSSTTTTQTSGGFGLLGGGPGGLRP